MSSRRSRSWWPLLAVAVLLVVAGGMAAVANPQLTSLPVPESGGRQSAVPDNGPALLRPSTSTARPEQVARPVVPGWVVTVLGGVLVAVVVGGLLVMLWLVVRERLWSRPGRIEQLAAAPTMPVADEVVAAVDAGLSDLSDTDLDPRRAVIACWVRLEQVAAAAGTPRQVSDTPSELVTRLLAAHDVDSGVLADFADIYRRARYTTHTVDERMRGQARAALERVRSELTGVRR